MITATQLAAITHASSDLIGKCNVLYFAGHRLHEVSVAGHHEDLENSLQSIADALGYEIVKREAPAVAEAAE
ncbi:hypothetical protein IB238_09240 [Rhizobium sp. ARZ01]|uniref:hypothetical protein n=1 Tax=Rhizobium sp. ARZ01 TaxID=2769313 RepID=UPI001783F164|nr:hypothetical protein [Rhizobium sp. ARZ01]MBD9372802.1 hypothetical protein [Rhizobium sp. ARZ01]